MNKKGFVLVETIITSVFVLSLFTFTIANLVPLVGEYDKVRDYDSIESIYDAHMIRKMFLKGDLARVSKLAKLPADGYYMFSGTDVCYYLSNVNYCKALLSRDYLDVKKIIITDFAISDDFLTKSKGFERSLREYIAQMKRYNNTSPSPYNTERRLIIAFNDGRFVNIELLFDKVGA